MQCGYDVGYWRLTDTKRILAERRGEHERIDQAITVLESLDDSDLQYRMPGMSVGLALR